MIKHHIVEISEKVYHVGVRDRNRRLFDALITLPKGTTYNSYLVIGEDKKALIDTVNPGFEKELESRVREIVDPSDLDYVIMNHAEPDHSGAIPFLMSINSKAKLVTTGRGARMAQIFYNVPSDRIKIVSDQETIDLGGRILRFIDAPMLHWPETMFTYLQEKQILFTCDFFGAHVAEGNYEDDIKDLAVHAKSYFGEIMMPYRVMGEKALEKIKNLDIKIIAPSHGPIYKNPEKILELYRQWVHGETKQKAILIYATMWKSTEKMILQMAETLASEKIEVALYNLNSSDIGDIARDLVDSRALVLGAPTMLGGIHPIAQYATYLVKILKPPAKFGVVLNSYGWGKGAIQHVQEILGPSKLEVIGRMEINGPPTEEHVKQIIELGKTLAEKIKSIS